MGTIKRITIETATWLRTAERFALFDVDGVLARPYVIEHFPKFVVEQGLSIFTASTLEQMLALRKDYENGHLTYEKYASLLVLTYAKGISGQKVEDVRHGVNLFWQNTPDVVYPYTQKIVELLKRRFTLIAISGSPSMVLQPWLTTLGFTAVFGTEINVRNGVYIDAVDFNGATYDGKNKVIGYLKNVVPDDTVWINSISFGDNPVHDLPLLQLVGHPFLVVDERNREKDVILLRKQVPSAKIVTRGRIAAVASRIAAQLV